MEDKTVAIDILAEAGKLVGGGRDIHGSVDNSYSMVAQLWEVYLRHSNFSRHNNPQAGHLHIDTADVLEMLSLLKKGRFVYATEPNRENFVDDAGYVALAGMIAMPKPPQHQLLRQDHPEEIDTGIRTIASALRPRRPSDV